MERLNTGVIGMKGTAIEGSVRIVGVDRDGRNPIYIGPLLVNPTAVKVAELGGLLTENEDRLRSEYSDLTFNVYKL